jgi:Tol biopolymer transport system component
VIAFNSDRTSPGELLGFVVDSMGGKPRRIGDYFFEYPSWSPDGRRFVFMHQNFQ